jgi:hypothetical protein
MRRDTISTSLIIKAVSFEARVTETNLVILTAPAILPIKPHYIDGDTWMNKDGRHLLVNSQNINPPTPGYADMIIKIDAAVLTPAWIMSAYGAMKRKGKHIPRRPHGLSCILDSPGHLEITERGVSRKVEAKPALKNTTTVMMAATEQSPSGEATSSDEHQLGFGSINMDDLWVPGGFDERLRPVAEFDLAAQLEKIGVLAGEPRSTDPFTHYPLKNCPFNTQHKRVVLSQHKSGTLTYLCPHYSCQGKKKGFDRKTAHDYFAYYGVTIEQR